MQLYVAKRFMKKTKILTIAGVMLAMALTGCKTGGKTSESKAPESSGNPTSQPTSQPTSNPSTNPSTSGGGQSTSTTPAPQIHIHDLAGSEKVDVLEEEGAVAEEMYKCKDCDKYAVAWSALDYDVTKTTERSTSKPDSRASGKAIRFSSTANYQDGDVTKKGCHIVYNVYLPEAVENANLLVKMAKRNDTNDIFAKYEEDQAKGYEYIPQASGDPVLDRPATRYGIKLDGNVYIIPEDNTNQSWKDDIGWYQFPGQLPALTAGAHEIEIYNLGGFRTDMYNFALVGFGPHEHVDNFKQLAVKTNDDNKPVYLGQDSFTGKKAIEIAFKDFHEAPANPDGTNPWYMKKNSFATWTINVDKAIEGAKLYFSLQASSSTHLDRHIFNEAKYNAEHPDAPVALPSQNPDSAEEDDWRYAVAVGETNFPILNNKTWKESGVEVENKQFYVYFADINLAAGANVIKLTQCNMGYRMRFNQNVRIVYKSDATITGEDYVPPVPKVNFKEWVKADFTACVPNAASLTSTTYADDIVGYKWNNATNAKAAFTYEAAEAGKATFRLLLSAKKGNEANTTFWIYNNAAKTKVYFNDVEVPAPADNFNMSACATESATAKDGNSTMMEPVWFDIMDVDLIQGANTIRVEFVAGSYSYYLCGAALAR